MPAIKIFEPKPNERYPSNRVPVRGLRLDGTTIHFKGYLKKGEKKYPWEEFSWGIPSRTFTAVFRHVPVGECYEFIIENEFDTLLETDPKEIKIEVIHSEEYKEKRDKFLARCKESYEPNFTIEIPETNGLACPDYFFAYGTLGTENVAAASMNSTGALYIDNNPGVDWCAVFPALDEGYHTLTVTDSLSQSRQVFNVHVSPSHCE